MSVRRNYLFSLASQAAHVAALAVIMAVIARSLGPAGKGAVGLIIALPTIVAGITLLGLQAGITYYAGSGRASLGVLAANALVYTAVVGALVTGLAWLARTPAAAALRLEFDAGLWRWAVLLLVPTYLLECGTALLAGARRFARVALVNAAAGAVFAAMFTGLLLRGNGTVATACLLFVVYRAVRAAGVWMVIPWREAGRVRPDAAVFRGTLGYSVQGQVGKVLQILVYRLDLFLVNGLAGLTAAGLYTAATFLAEGLAHAASALRAVVLPEVAAREGDAARNLATRVGRQTLWSMVAASIVLGIVAPVLVPLMFGDAFRPAVPAVWLLLPGIVALSVSRVLVAAVAGGGWPWAGSVAAAVGLVLTIIFDLVLIPKWGFVGAAAASSIAYGVQCLSVIVLFRKQTGATLGDILRLERTDYTLFRDVVARVSNG